MTTDKQTSETVENIVEVKKLRPGKRDFGYTGALTHIENLTLPGYRLYLANEVKNGNPNRLFDLTRPEVGYAFVHPREVNFTDAFGKIVEGDKIKVDIGRGTYAYLLKQPEDWANEDRKDKLKASTAGILNKSVSTDSHIQDVDTKLIKN